MSENSDAEFEQELDEAYEEGYGHGWNDGSGSSFRLFGISVGFSSVMTLVIIVGFLGVSSCVGEIREANHFNTIANHGKKLKKVYEKKFAHLGKLSVKGFMADHASYKEAMEAVIPVLASTKSELKAIQRRGHQTNPTAHRMALMRLGGIDQFFKRADVRLGVLAIERVLDGKYFEVVEKKIMKKFRRYRKGEWRNWIPRGWRGQLEIYERTFIKKVKKTVRFSDEVKASAKTLIRAYRLASQIFEIIDDFKNEGLKTYSTNWIVNGRIANEVQKHRFTMQYLAYVTRCGVATYAVRDIDELKHGVKLCKEVPPKVRALTQKCEDSKEDDPPSCQELRAMFMLYGINEKKDLERVILTLRGQKKIVQCKDVAAKLASAEKHWNGIYARFVVPEKAVAPAEFAELPSEARRANLFTLQYYLKDQGGLAQISGKLDRATLQGFFQVLDNVQNLRLKPKLTGYEVFLHGWRFSSTSTLKACVVPNLEVQNVVKEKLYRDYLAKKKKEKSKKQLAQN